MIRHAFFLGVFAGLILMASGPTPAAAQACQMCDEGVRYDGIYHAMAATDE